MRETIGAEGGASNGGELLAGVNVLHHRLVQTRQMAMPLFQH